MKPTTTARRPVLLGSLRELVRHAADSMGLSLEIWDGPGRAPERIGLAAPCVACEQRDARVFDRCRKRRTYLSRREVALPAELAERCPLRLRLARAGAAEGDAGPTLFAFGYRSEGEETQMDERVLSFLRDLRRLLAESAEMQSTLSQVNDELTSKSEEIDLLVSVSGRLGGANDLHRTILQVLGEWRGMLAGEAALLWLRSPERLDISSARGVAPGPDERPVWETFARRLFETLERSGHDTLVERLGPAHPLAKRLGADCDVIAVPLVLDGHRRGVACGLRRVGRDFAPEEVRLLRSLASQLGLALENSALLEDVRNFLTNTVKTLVSAIDAKDSYTAGHSERVNIVSMLVGNEMNLDLVDLEALYWGSLLHDVGKIGMPESILNKPTTLDPDEVEIVKQHPQRGWDMLHAIKRLQDAALGVLHHHERWDGEGYPGRLAGSGIPLVARIIAVADAFDAIISNRSYRRARPAARAVAVIEESVGTQFDPEVVAALARLLPLLEKHQWVLMSGHKGTGREAR